MYVISGPTSNPFANLEKQLNVGGAAYKYYDIPSLGEKYGKSYRIKNHWYILPKQYFFHFFSDKLPFSIRVLLESAVRNCDNFQVLQKDVENILNWNELRGNSAASIDTEVSFKPARVILQDFTGVPAVVDFAAMRDAVRRLGGDPNRINPICPSDLVIDHSVQVDFAREPDALNKNQDLEFERNKERFTFLKWGAKAFNNMLIVPPGSGIVHQVNLEYLARVVFSESPEGEKILYPDSVVGTDSHTTMINGLGVLGWGVS